ncbi:MAG: hypothetical protein SA339_10950 [Methanomassiliicoccus sp.]|nr:hypothetical protein [Methanomassiliicoccus sp.]
MFEPIQVPASLTWRQAGSVRRSYELVSEARILASMQFPRLFSDLAEVRIGDAEYSLDRTGILHPKVILRRGPFQEELGQVMMGWRAAWTMEILDGRRYTVERRSIWGGLWALIGSSNEVLAEVRVRPAILRQEAEVTVHERGSRDRDLPLFLTVAWYLVILNQQDSAAASSAGVAST